MKAIKAHTALGQQIIKECTRTGNDLFTAYEKPSHKKITAWLEIQERAKATPGYNNDLHIIGHSYHNYSTGYTYTENGKTYAVKDTKSYTYIVEY